MRMKNTKKMENFNKKRREISRGRVWGTFYVFYIIDYFFVSSGHWTFTLPNSTLYTFTLPTNPLYTDIYIFLCSLLLKNSHSVLFFFLHVYFSSFLQIFHARIFIEEHQQTTGKNNWNLLLLLFFFELNFFFYVFYIFH